MAQALPNQALRIKHSAVKCRTADPLTRVVLRKRSTYPPQLKPSWQQREGVSNNVIHEVKLAGCYDVGRQDVHNVSERPE